MLMAFNHIYLAVLTVQNQCLCLSVLTELTELMSNNKTLVDY